MTATTQHLTAARIRELRDRLEADRAAFFAEYEQDLERERAIPADEVGDLADRAEAATDRETLLDAAEGDLERLRLIDDALRRINDGSYGTCLAGGEAIPLQRLRALPWARYCAAHQEEWEAGQRATAGWSRMKRSIHAIPILVLIGLAIGCATAPSPPPPLPVIAAPAELSTLAGEWTGDYWSAATGRRGVIRFQLQADTGAAWGDVWMFPADHPEQPGEGDRERGRHAASALEIRFVRVEAGGALNGTIEPYRDPECDCMLSTTFTGQLSGDRIEGTYTTRGGVGHPVTTGKWEVRRAAKG